MKVGIMGGTFDPIHLGHLEAARIACRELGLDRVWVVPAGVPPHRTAPQAGALDRFAMVCLAVQGDERFVVSSIELDRAGPSYTVDTVARLCESSPEATFHLIVGSDTLAEMGTWHDVSRLVTMCRVAVVERPESPALEEPVPAWADRLEGMGLAVSSTRVRKMVARGENLDGLLATAVAEHVRKRGLYR